jgi:plastocyanin
MNKLNPNSPAPGRFRLIRSSFAIAVFGLAAAAFTIPAPASAQSKPAVVVKMSDKPPVFIPAKVTIKPGQTIEWINNAKTLHSVDADPSMVQKGSDVVLPPGAKPFDSGFMQPGATYEHTFTVPGTYKYTCVPHEKDHMDGEVIVQK